MKSLYEQLRDADRAIRDRYKLKEKQMKQEKREMPTKEQIIDAASDCGTTKKALEKLFPWAFEDDLSVDFGSGHRDIYATNGDFIMGVSHTRKHVVLSRQYKWTIGDNYGMRLRLTPNRIVDNEI